MSRDVSGNYTLPAGNPVVDGTLIDVTWANPTMADIAVQLNNVTTRDGVLGMLAPFKLTAGSAALPAAVPSGDPNTGMYFPAADTLGFSTAGTMRIQVAPNGNVGISVAPTQLLDVGGCKITGSLSILSNTTVTTTIPIGTNFGYGGLCIIRGADLPGVAFCALYLIAVRVTGGASPDVDSVAVSRAGTITPTFAFGSSGGFLTITSTNNGTVSLASFVGF